MVHPCEMQSICGCEGEKSSYATLGDRLFELPAYSDICFQYEHSVTIVGHEAAVQVLSLEVHGLGVSTGQATSYHRNGVVPYFYLLSDTCVLSDDCVILGQVQTQKWHHATQKQQPAKPVNAADICRLVPMLFAYKKWRWRGACEFRVVVCGVLRRCSLCVILQLSLQRRVAIFVTCR